MPIAVIWPSKDDIEALRGGGKGRRSPEDFSQKGAIFLRPKAQFDSLRSPTATTARAHRSHGVHRGGLRKPARRAAQSEYRGLDNAVLGQLLRT